MLEAAVYAEHNQQEQSFTNPIFLDLTCEWFRVPVLRVKEAKGS